MKHRLLPPATLRARSKRWPIFNVARTPWTSRPTFARISPSARAWRTDFKPEKGRKLAHFACLLAL